VNIILMGYRCTGKTSVGRLLAAKLQRPFFDTDELIKKNTGKSVREMVEQKGWGSFRQEEKRLVGNLAGKDGSVIALGGGAVLEEENVGNLQTKGFFIWLTANVHAIRERMIGDGKSPDQRPPLSGADGPEETQALLRIREPLYAKIADCRVDTSNRNVEEVAEVILGIVGKTAEFHSRKRKTDGR
jgi:shikimate kinase